MGKKRKEIVRKWQSKEIQKSIPPQKQQLQFWKKTVRINCFKILEINQNLQQPLECLKIKENHLNLSKNSELYGILTGPILHSLVWL